VARRSPSSCGSSSAADPTGDVDRAGAQAPDLHPPLLRLLRERYVINGIEEYRRARRVLGKNDEAEKAVLVDCSTGASKRRPQGIGGEVGEQRRLGAEEMSRRLYGLPRCSSCCVPQAEAMPDSDEATTIGAEHMDWTTE
jgi:hypothetical protein